MEQLTTTIKISSAKCISYWYYRVDLIKPSQGLQFTLDDFLNKSKEVGVFINTLIDLDKMQAFDNRDPYEDRA